MSKIKNQKSKIKIYVVPASRDFQNFPFSIFHFVFARPRSGQVLIQVLVFGAMAVILIVGFVQWAGLQLRAGRQLSNREQALTIAEAGIEYYRWHLAHSSEDYQDGTGGPGPYTHLYYNKDGSLIGRFILTITPPPVGSTIVTILSEGRVEADSNLSRKIQVQMAIPSWAKFAYVTDSFVWFGDSEEVFGTVHSNVGVRFDGRAYNLVTSAVDKFNDPDHSGGDEFGVHTHRSPIDPLPPAAVPDRPDVFLTGRRFAVPALDFTGLSADLAQLRTKAQSGGLYFANSGNQGYHIVLKTDDNFDLYRVTGLVPSPPGCNISSQGTKWGTWSIQSQILIGTYAFPVNGIIFLEDHVWVDGQIASARVTIVSARFPESAATNTNIIVNDDLRFTNFDGSDVIGLIAQGYFLIGLKSANDLEVDAAIVAKNDATFRFYYRSACGTGYLRNILTLRGMAASRQRGAFAYAGGGGVVSGYPTQTAIYDANLLYAPPPSFPLTSDQYSTISWEEVK